MVENKGSRRYFCKVLEVRLPPIEPWLPFPWLPGEPRCEWDISRCGRYRETHLRCLLCSTRWQGGGAPVPLPAKTQPARPSAPAPAASEDEEEPGLENKPKRGSVELKPRKPLPQSSRGDVLLLKRPAGCRSDYPERFGKSHAVPGSAGLLGTVCRRLGDGGPMGQIPSPKPPFSLHSTLRQAAGTRRGLHGCSYGA